MSSQMKRDIAIFLVLAFVILPMVAEHTDAKPQWTSLFSRLFNILRGYTSHLLYLVGVRDAILHTVEELEGQLVSILETITGYNNSIARYQGEIVKWTSRLTTLATQIGTLQSEIRTLDNQISGLDGTISDLNDWIAEWAGRASPSVENQKRTDRQNATNSRDAKKEERSQKYREISNKEYARSVALSEKWASQQYLAQVEQSKRYAEGQADVKRVQIQKKKARLPQLETGISQSNTNISNTNAEIARLEAEQAAAEEAAQEEEQEGDD